MAQGKTQIIEQDGKTYEFTPGKYGSTVVRVTRNRNPQPLLPEIKPKAKVIPPLGAVRG